MSNKKSREKNMNARVTAAVSLKVILLYAGWANADVFGAGTNEFTIDFVTISGATNPTSGYGIVNNDYRMGVYEITNDQWNKFEAELGGPVTGDPPYAYDESPYHTGINMPTNEVSWYEAAQFVNWLNTSTGYQSAYKFWQYSDTQGVIHYQLMSWSAAEADNGTNLYRHKDAMYYLPTVDEWVKAAYWNGGELQTYATKAGESLTQGDGVSGSGWNYYEDGYALDPAGPWDVGSGSEELNGTFDMMGNVSEWMENPVNTTGYEPDADRLQCGGGYGSFGGTDGNLASLHPGGAQYPHVEDNRVGFRVASDVPDPCALSLLTLGGLALIRCRRK